MAHSSLIFLAFRSLLTLSYHRKFGLHLGIFPSILISATARLFSVSYLLLTFPNYSSFLRLITVAIGSTFASSNISSFFQCSNRLIPIGSSPLPIAPFSSLFLPYAFHMAIFRTRKTWPYFAPVKQRLSNHYLIYQELQLFWNFLVAYHTAQSSPFRPCLCHSVLIIFAGSSSSVYS